jgi:hypothetical protein
VAIYNLALKIADRESGPKGKAMGLAVAKGKRVK